jgi:predicted  nucleic acid-binding Zn-ribbon protein
MDKKDIETLLEAQAVDRERLTLINSVYGGVAKRNLDSATKLLTGTKENLLALESDAQNLTATFNKIAKAINDTIKVIDDEKLKSEDDEDAGTFGSLLSKISILEGQLSNIERQISDKSAAFERAKETVAIAQRTIQNTTAEFEKQKNSIKDTVADLDAKFEKTIKTVDEKLSARYKNIRRQKGTDPKDIVVPMTADSRCGGCYFEIPLSQISKIKMNGCIVCEECSKIIYNGAE